MNTKVQGTVGVGQAIAYFTSLGWIVAVPLNDSQKYDLIVDNGERLLKIQVKTSRNEKRPGIFEVLLRQCGGSRKTTTYRHFNNTESDLLFVHCGDGSRYLIPCDQIKNRSTLNLPTAYLKYRI